MSPSGTPSTLLGHRDLDNIIGGYYEWPFMSVMFWGENPTGEWTLVVTSRSSDTQVNISNVQFQFFGVSNTPQSVANIPDVCHTDCARGCADEGSNYCDACVNLRDAYTMECIDICPVGYNERNGYCYNPNLPINVCNSPLKDKDRGEVSIHTKITLPAGMKIINSLGSCVDAAYVGCCVAGDCEVFAQDFPVSCFCDAFCYIIGDCCDDIALISCYQDNSKSILETHIVF